MKKSIMTWGVKEKGNPDKISVSYNIWKTKQEAIDGFTKLTGKSWEELESQGAELVQRKIWIDDKSDRPSTK